MKHICVTCWNKKQKITVLDVAFQAVVELEFHSICCPSNPHPYNCHLFDVVSMIFENCSISLKTQFDCLLTFWRRFLPVPWQFVQLTTVFAIRTEILEHNTNFPYNLCMLLQLKSPDILIAHLFRIAFGFLRYLIIRFDNSLLSPHTHSHRLMLCECVCVCQIVTVVNALLNVSLLSIQMNVTVTLSWA